MAGIPEHNRVRKPYAMNASSIFSAFQPLSYLKVSQTFLRILAETFIPALDICRLQSWRTDRGWLLTEYDVCDSLTAFLAISASNATSHHKTLMGFKHSFSL